MVIKRWMVIVSAEFSCKQGHEIWPSDKIFLKEKIIIWRKAAFVLCPPEYEVDFKNHYHTKG